MIEGVLSPLLGLALALCATEGGSNWGVGGSSSHSSSNSSLLALYRNDRVVFGDFPVIFEYYS